MPSVEERLQALEDASSASRAEASVPPNGLVVLPNGEIAFEFEGSIVPLGLTMIEGNTSAETINKVGWLNVAAAKFKEYITGLQVGGTRHKLQFQAGNGPGVKEGNLWSSVMELVGSDVEPAANTNGLFVSVAAKTTKALIGCTIFDESQQSSFMQLARSRFLFGANVEINFGSVILEYGAGATQSNVRTVNHQLEKVPSIILTGVENEEGSRLTTVKAINRNATNFQMQGNATAGFGGAANFEYSWLAIG